MITQGRKALALSFLLPLAVPAREGVATEPPAPQSPARGVDGAQGGPLKKVEHPHLFKLALTNGEKVYITTLDSFPSDCTYGQRDDSTRFFQSLLFGMKRRTSSENWFATARLDNPATRDHEGIHAIAEFLKSYLPKRSELLQKLEITDWRRLTPKQAILLSAEITKERIRYNRQPEESITASFDHLPISELLNKGETPEGNGECRTYVEGYIGIFKALQILQKPGESKLDLIQLFAETEGDMFAELNVGATPGAVAQHAWVGVVCRTGDGIFCMQLDPTWADQESQGIDPAQRGNDKVRLDHTPQRFLLPAHLFLRAGMIEPSALVKQLIGVFNQSYEQLNGAQDEATPVSPVLQREGVLQPSHDLSPEMRVGDWVVRLLTEYGGEVVIDGNALNRFLGRYGALLNHYNQLIDKSRPEWSKDPKNADEIENRWLQSIIDKQIEWLVKVCDERGLTGEGADRTLKNTLVDLVHNRFSGVDTLGNFGQLLHAFTWCKVVGDEDGVTYYGSRLKNECAKDYEGTSLSRRQRAVQNLLDKIDHPTKGEISRCLQTIVSPEILPRQPSSPNEEIVAEFAGLGRAGRLSVTATQSKLKPDQLRQMLEDLKVVLKDEPDLLPPSVTTVAIISLREKTTFMYRSYCAFLSDTMSTHEIAKSLRMHHAFTNRFKDIQSKTSAYFQRGTFDINLPHGEELIFLKNIERYFTTPERQKRFSFMSFSFTGDGTIKSGVIPLNPKLFLGSFKPSEVDAVIDKALQTGELK